MCHDLLDMDGNKYIYETTNGGRRENKEVLLEEHDPIWVELRDLFIADASVRLTDKMQTFASKNKAAQIKLGTRYTHLLPSDSCCPCPVDIIGLRTIFHP
jgi:syntaxin-binding protein 1